MITIPFEIELAKKIQNREYPGKIVTRDDRDVRIICWDKKDDFPIIALVAENADIENIKSYANNGSYYNDGDINDLDLILQVSKWTQFKDGDILACEVHNGPNDYCKWFSILEGKVDFVVSNIEFGSYASYDYDSSYNVGRLTYDDYPDNIGSIRLATEEEKQIFIKRLQEENTDKAREILKRFFGIEEKPKCEFEPFQKVLVRDSDDEIWMADFFSHYDNDRAYKHVVCGIFSFRFCIPYNEETKHLLGTTDNWEEE